MSPIPSILRHIVESKQEEIAAGRARQGTDELRARIADQPACRGFAAAIDERRASAPAVIAEIKRASPSAGLIREDFDPEAIARSYDGAGATCLSVLTDSRHFQGSAGHLAAARAACALPVLRKDFMIDSWQILESRHIGADCVLLIVAALSAGQLQDLSGVAREAGLDVLVEVHDERELEAALATDSRLIGVNNRDLHRFTTDLGVSQRLRPLIPPEHCMITESGIHSRADVQRMLDCGIDAFLIGEALMRANDPGRALQGLFEP